ncbi:MAG: 30S ribosomal protein S30e [Candidatus Bathyarchaeota archaeon]|nr:30S ribosomal protein S30e [Candidatus Bathyarchaeota archaeon]
MPTHGSLSKAGKVRSQTPKIAPKNRRSSGPRVSNRRIYDKRFILGRNVGQYKDNYRRRR